ncbi:UNVERIFIED_CONTAM: hypothetical protein PYX00_010463 [Menopon gallinae]|uniref:Spondin-1 n=1 Tax=Menopon gallinae TaxID=328185 RepID=A0AAW2HFN7_9NEOP
MQGLSLVILCSLASTALGVCVRQPSPYQSIALKSPGDNGFRIQINGDPDRYVPGSSYVVSVIGGRNNNGLLTKFRGFTVTVEASHSHSDVPDDSLGSDSPARVGAFMLYSEEQTQYHDDCINTIKESNMEEKTEIQIMWTAPPKGSGCVIFRAMVLVDGETWFADDGMLSKKICEITPEYLLGEEDVEGNSLECCACDEAKYTMVFEGIWSSKTHPKDFPKNLWLTHFSDVIGATHRRNFSFWGEGQIASDGLRQVAEWGSGRILEAELRAKAKYLKTMIKAAGLWHPRVNENTTSTFKVDKERNLLSVVSMFGPTPDWIVGVSGLNLCKRDCTWIENKVVNLYPYDAGTDSGISYESPNEPTVPRERIHRITPLYPEDPRAPFYDPLGKPMQPLARLHLQLQKVIPKRCEEFEEGFLEVPLIVDYAENTEDNKRPECEVTEYGPWSDCSVTCGKGIKMRSRSYVMGSKAVMLGCDRQLVSKEMCVASQPTCTENPFSFSDLRQEEEEDNEGFCRTTPFGEWTECSERCGKGFRMKSRSYLMPEKAVMMNCNKQMVIKEMCIGHHPSCPANLFADFAPDPVLREEEFCRTTPYSEWSECSASCGKGLRMKTRTYLMPEKAALMGCDKQLVMKEMCTARQPSCAIDPFQYTEDSDESLEDLEEVCRTSEYSEWSECSTTCGVGVTMRTRRFFDHWGRKKCPHVSLVEKKECIRPACPPPSPGISMDDRCTTSEWTDWSPCSATCGTGLMYRSRQVLVGGELKDICAGRVEVNQQRMCTLQADCSVDRLSAKRICMLEPDIGPCRGFFERWYFDPREKACVTFPYGGCRGNRNNFKHQSECNEACGAIREQLLSNELVLSQNTVPTSQRVDCITSEWSEWTPCSVSCGVGKTIRFRTVQQQPQNGGRPCPNKLLRKKTCQGPPCV